MQFSFIIFGDLWYSYDDIRDHRLMGADALGRDWVRRYDRCLLFLASDREYSSPPIVERFLSLISRWLRPPRRPTDDVWPFRDWTDYEEIVSRLGGEAARSRQVLDEYEAAMAEISLRPDDPR
jgi:hypothetical protein